MAAENCTCGGNETCENCVSALKSHIKEEGERIDRDWKKIIENYRIELSVDEEKEISLIDSLINSFDIFLRD